MPRPGASQIPPQRKRAMIYSGGLHLLVGLLLFFGLPEFFEDDSMPEPSALSVEILPISEVSNIKPMPKKSATPPKPDPASKKPAPPKPDTAKKAVPKTKTEDAQPKPKEAIAPPKPEDEKKPEEKPDEKPKPEPKEEVDDLQSILKSVADAAEKEEADKPEDKAEEKKAEEDASESQAISDNYDPTQPMTMTEEDAIRSQIQKYWNVPAGAKDAHELKVVLRVRLNPDGSLIEVRNAGDMGRYNSDPFYRAATDSAMRAVKRASPLQNLPTDKYNTWKDMELTFDPKEMLY